MKVEWTGGFETEINIYYYDDIKLSGLYAQIIAIITGFKLGFIDETDAMNALRPLVFEFMSCGGTVMGYVP